MRIRPARLSDAVAIQKIYFPYVAASCISFETTSPDVSEIEGRIRKLLPDYPYLVVESGDGVQGYAYVSPHRRRAAYSSSVETAVYLSREFQGQGAGKALMSQLLSATAKRGYHAAFAGIALPNPASIALHEALGFTKVGVFREVGSKFGNWIDVGWWQLLLDQSAQQRFELR